MTPPLRGVAFSRHLRLRLGAALRGLGHGTAEPNPVMVKVMDVLKLSAPDTRANWELLKVIGDYYKTVRDPEAIAEFAAYVWQYAAKKQITTAKALEEIASGGLTPVRLVGDLERRHLFRGAPFIDVNFGPPDPHGRYTHMFTEAMISYFHGPGTGAKFRQLIARATGPRGVSQPDKQFYESVWDAMFDEYGVSHINRPEDLGPLLAKHLGLI